MRLWLAAPQRPRLGRGRVHVYLADLTAQADDGVLSAEEAARAARFAFDADRRRYAAAHAVLRRILARYLGCAPAEVLYDLGPQGKPALAGGGLEFNMSHCGDLALYAVTQGREVGVDIERMRPEVGRELAGAGFLTPSETGELLALPEAERPKAFFTVWTRKEACLKATGKGLSTPLNAFSVWPQPDPPFHVVDLEVGPGFAAAVAAQGGGWTVACWRW